MTFRLILPTALFISTVLISTTSPVLAQQQLDPDSPTGPSGGGAAQADPAEAEEQAEIVVTGRRQPGTVIGDIPAEQQLSPADIRSYGVSSVAELLNELAPQTRSGRGSGGAPVVLLNGKRVSGFSEIRDIPTEAILRVDILPEEVALKYGYRADQRVVNFVLRPRFRAITAELESRFATQGGNATPSGEFNLLRISQNDRINLHAEFQERESITEADRNIRLSPSLFATSGNVVGVGGGEIDPALSAQAGSLVTVAGIPSGAQGGTPSLADFAATANRANVTDQTRFRTLTPASTGFNANGSYSTTIFGDVGATLNGRIETTRTRSLLGLSTVELTLPVGNRYSPFSRDVLIDRGVSGDFLPLAQVSDTLTGNVGATFNGNIGRWQWSVIGSFERSESKTFTDVGIDAAPFQARLNANDPTARPFEPLVPGDVALLPINRAYSTSNNGSIDALFNGSLFELPAGAVSTSVSIGGDFIDFSSRSVRDNVEITGNVTRNIANGQVNIDVPLTSRSRDVLGVLGNLSGNFNIAYDYLSDFDTLRTLGYGLNWSPIDEIRVIASVTEQDVAPSPQQLGNPVILRPNVFVFDYVRGENSLVSVVSGGNPALASESRQTTKIGLTVKPFDKPDLTFTANYVTGRTDNTIAGFPSVTAEIEAAFPGRFTRNFDGRLTQIDQRSINFARSDRSELRIGLNFSQPIKSKLQKQIEAFREGKGPDPFAGLAPNDRRRGGAAGAGAGAGGGGGGGRREGGGGRGGFGGGGGGGGDAGGRLQFAIYDTIHFVDRVRIGATGPELDLLNGDTIGDRGGQPRHELEAQAGYSNNGVGLRLSANWQSGTRVIGGTPAAPQTLNFSPLGTVNARLFADLGQRLDLVRKRPWLRGVRVLIAVDNVFNTRQRVTDQLGATPISYQPGYLDPLGRSIRISLRKIFF